MRPESLGRYEVIRHLASGGMAHVYLARASGLGGFARHVVVKAMASERRDEEAYVAMFLDEARLAAMLHHQHIAQVFEVGCADDGTYFLVMEYVHGETVRHVLEAARGRGAKLPLELGVSVTCAAAAGLHHAHECCDIDGRPLDIVHRDVSPSNVILGYDGAIKLIDFGIAKANHRQTRTVSGCIKGKTGYMAPEQARGYRVDRRSDVFALGVLAYELTTQTRAFHGPSQFETIERTLRGEVIPPSHIVPGYPPALEHVIMTALEVDPDDRFQDADAMRSALEEAARELGLVVGEASVIQTLRDLFVRRPEPWLAGAIEDDDDDDPTPVLGESMPIMVAPARVARGTERIAFPLPALAAGRADRADPVPVLRDVVDPLDLTTRPFERELPFESHVAPPVAPSPPTPVPRASSHLIPTPPLALVLVPRPAPPAPLLPPPPPEPLLPSPPAPRASSPMLLAAPPFSAFATRQRAAAVRSSRKVAKVVVAVVVLALGFVGGAIVLEQSYGDTASTTPDVPAAAPAPIPAATTPAPTPPAPTPATAPPAPVAAARPGTVQLDVTTEPAGATVVLDGVRLGTTPFSAPVPAKAGGAWLKVRMHGRVAVRTRVSLDHDVRWNVELKPLSR